jgi:hypothetical protein
MPPGSAPSATWQPGASTQIPENAQEDDTRWSVGGVWGRSTKRVMRSRSPSSAKLLEPGRWCKSAVAAAPGAAVLADQRRQIVIGQDVAIVDQQILAQFGQQLPAGARGAQRRLLEAVVDVHAEPCAVAQVRGELFGAVVQVDDQLAKAPRRQVAHDVLDDRHAADLQHRFGAIVAQGTQARAEPGTQDQRLHDQLPFRTCWMMCSAASSRLPQR